MKKTSNLNRALAIANLVNLGRSPVESLNISRDWAQRQHAQSLGGIDNLLRQVAADIAAPKVPKQGRMFASFHFSLYPLLYIALAQRSGPGVVYSLIGQQQEGHRTALKQLAVNYGFQIEFIESNPSMVKTLRRAIAADMPGILLLDIPWSKRDGQPDVSYRVTGGHFKGHSSLERLLKLIDPEYEILLTRYESGKFQIENVGSLGLERAFDVFGKLLQSDPADYERLHQFHKFFEFDVLQNCVITFSIQDKHYLLHAKTMQAWETSSPVPSRAITERVDSVSYDAQIVNHFSKEIGHELDYVISI